MNRNERQWIQKPTIECNSELHVFVYVWLDDGTHKTQVKSRVLSML